MFAGLDILPLDSARAAVRPGAGVDLLERPADPDCAAGVALWDLYLAHHDKDRSRISPRLADLGALSPRGLGAGPLLLGMSLGAAGRGAGLFLCADRSCLVLRCADDKPWGKSPDPERRVDILPVVLRLIPHVAHGDDLFVKIGINNAEGGHPQVEMTPLSATGEVPDFDEIRHSLGAQLCWEATAWGNTLQGLPALSPGGAWPAAFPNDGLDPDTAESLEAWVRDAANWLLETERDMISEVSIRIFSGRRLQGGIAPARLSASFSPVGWSDILSAQEHDRLVGRLERMIFASPSPFRADHLIAQKMRQKDGRSRGLERVGLCNTRVSGRPSNHDRLRLHAIFATLP